jgi:hypothetical protein
MEELLFFHSTLSQSDYRDLNVHWHSIVNTEIIFRKPSKYTSVSPPDRDMSRPVVVLVVPASLVRDEPDEVWLI